jgi:hypothetical protein
MTGYREILRLAAQGISQRSIAKSCECSRNTVAKILILAQQKALEWNKAKELTDGDLHQLLFPDQIKPGSHKAPDCEYIHREMAKSGVTLSLLWNEYCEQCRNNNEIPPILPLLSSVRAYDQSHHAHHTEARGTN